MSHWVRLAYPDGRELLVDRHEEGGTFALGGVEDAELNVTYNYGEVYRIVGFEGISSLDGKRAMDVEQELDRVVTLLGTRKFASDYWAPTPGNAGHALNILLGWARQHPDAVFKVT